MRTPPSLYRVQRCSLHFLWRRRHCLCRVHLLHLVPDRGARLVAVLEQDDMNSALRYRTLAALEHRHLMSLHVHLQHEHIALAPAPRTDPLQLRVQSEGLHYSPRAMSLVVRLEARSIVAGERLCRDGHLALHAAERAIPQEHALPPMLVQHYRPRRQALQLVIGGQHLAHVADQTFKWRYHGLKADNLLGGVRRRLCARPATPPKSEVSEDVRDVSPYRVVRSCPGIDQDRS
mmetsp:Transcript_23569/g.58502  ORF Transcript_23569/g.58502 Transcript_23569/m.58502 type:complete len:233 (+) Transcript_23569:146-844(+)